ncbi:hypothetical protein ACFU4Z_07150, partial [Nocardia sp. NPDC057440]
MTELAEQAEAAEQNAGLLVGQLERADYVRHVPHPADARARLVRLTRRGTEATALANRVAAEFESEWSTHIGTRTMVAPSNNCATSSTRYLVGSAGPREVVWPPMWRAEGGGGPDERH